MSVRKYMEIIWMDLIGVGFISVGLYMIIFLSVQTPVYAPMGFVLMVLGLFFSTIGGFYGKKKLMEGSAEKLPLIEAKQIDHLKQNVVSQLKPPETSGDSPKVVQPRPEIKPPTEAKPSQSQKAATPPSIHQSEIAPPAEPSAGVIKILMCPGCNTENPPSNMFCSNCGKRLKAPAKTARPKSKKKRVKTVSG